MKKFLKSSRGSYEVWKFYVKMWEQNLKLGWNLKSEEKLDTNDFNILRFLFHVSSYSNFT